MTEKEWMEILVDMDREDSNRHRRYRRYNLSLDWMGDLANTSEHDSEIILDALEKAMVKLTWKQRKVLKLIYYHGYTTNEVAKIMECDPSAIRHIKRRALKSLREKIK